MVVLHADHHLVLHRKSGRLSDGRENDHADRERRRSRGTNRDILRHSGGRKHDDVFQSKYEKSRGITILYLTLIIEVNATHFE